MKLYITKMTRGQLIKITTNKKLMIKLDEQTYNQLTPKFEKFAKIHKLPERYPSFTLSNDDDLSVSHFVMISLDKYDKCNIARYEKLLKKQVAFSATMKQYDFIPEGQEEQVRGFNYVLNSTMTAVAEKKEEEPKQ